MRVGSSHLRPGLAFPYSSFLLVNKLKGNGANAKKEEEFRNVRLAHGLVSLNSLPPLRPLILSSSTLSQYTEACDRVKNFYREQHEKQTVEFNIKVSWCSPQSRL